MEPGKVVNKDIPNKPNHILPGGLSLAVSILILLVLVVILLLLIMASLWSPDKLGFSYFAHTFVRLSENLLGSLWVWLALLPVGLLNFVLGFIQRKVTSRGWKRVAWTAMITGTLAFMVCMSIFILFWIDQAGGVLG